MEENVNREIFNESYDADGLVLDPGNGYDRYMIDLRFRLIDEYGAGKDVLDLCCGTGSYLIPKLDTVGSAVGLDFSPRLLEGFKKNLGGGIPEKLRLVEADARDMPLDGESVDFVFSYASLYGIPDIEKVIGEIARVLRPGGFAALEMGNSRSMSVAVANVFHKKHNWPLPCAVPFGRMRGMFDARGLDIVRRRSFQILSMYGAPPGMPFLKPVTTPRWKSVMGIKAGGKIVDEWISGSWPLHHVAFRHLFILRKRSSAPAP